MYELDYSWSKDLTKILKEQDDKIVKICIQEKYVWEAPKTEPRYCDFDDPLFSKLFDEGFGGTEGCHFTAWGEKNVYFPVSYDGSECIGFVPRNPCLKASEHHGGG